MVFDIRLARSSEADAISDFCANFRGSYLPVPDVQEIGDAADDGYIFIVVERGREINANTIHACAGLFKLASAIAEDGSAVEVFETACTAINSNTLTGLKPFNLQQILFALRFAALSIFESARCCLIISIFDQNTRSIQNAISIGAVEIDSPEWLRRCRRSWCRPQEEKNVKDFIVNSENIGSHAEMLQKFLENPTLHRLDKISGKCFEHTFSLEIPWGNQVRTGKWGLIKPIWEINCPPKRNIGPRINS